MKLLEKIFSAKNTYIYKDFTILGRRIRCINTKKFKQYFKSLPLMVHAKSRYGKALKVFYTLIATGGGGGFYTASNCDFDSEQFSAEYRKLTAGLDKDSIATVDSAMTIYKAYMDFAKFKNPTIQDWINTGHSLKLPSDTTIKHLCKDFCDRIEKINDNLYRYKDYLLPVNHFESSVFYHRHSIDKLKTLGKIRNKNIIDVGGFVGDSAIIFSKYTDKNVYTFEASPENFELVKKTLELNKTSNVIPVNMALGDKAEDVLYVTGCTSGKTTTAVKYENSETINATTLDNYVQKHNIDVGLIKVDIEGYEQKFLKGAENTIKTQKPALLISIYHSFDDYMHIKPLIESWNLNYTFRIIKPEENPLLETLLVAEVLEK